MTEKFRDRADAAMQMAEQLAAFRGKNPLILAIPRGAVPMGKILAEALEGELDVVLVRKLGAPGNPEYAIGAVDENGWVTLAENAPALEQIAGFVERQKEQQLAICRERRQRYTPLRPPVSPEGRCVIVIDDGLATGATMIAALNAVRAQKPAELVCAVPVAHPGSLKLAGKHADAAFSVLQPSGFYAVGQFYRNFSQISDDEVERILAEQP